MKDLIVLVATVILGIFIAVLVLNLRSSASGINKSVNDKINTMVEEFDKTSVPAIK